jgi:hypothetical protein
LIEAREVIDRVGSRYPFPEDAFERFVCWRERRHRVPRHIASFLFAATTIGAILAHIVWSRG